MGFLFVFSFIVLLMLVTFRYWESSRGIVFLPGIRADADRKVMRLIEVFQERVIDGIIFLRDTVYIRVHDVLIDGSVHLIHVMQRRLASMKQYIKGRSAISPQREASNFLKTMQQHKQQLRKQGMR